MKEERLEITIEDYLKLAKAGELDKANELPGEELIKWVGSCPDEEIVNYSKRMANIFKGIKNGKVNPKSDTLLMFYSPEDKICGNFYILIQRQDESIMTIEVNNDSYKHKYAVLSILNNMDSLESVFETNSQVKLVEWLNTPWNEDDISYWSNYIR